MTLRSLPSTLSSLQTHGWATQRLRVFARCLCAVTLVAALSACGDSTAPAAKGSVTLDLSGLPSGALSELHLTKGTATKIISAGGTVADIETGNWTLTASPITIDGVIYEPTPVSQTVTVTAQGIGAAHIVWTAATGAIALSAAGLPSGAEGTAIVTGPDNFSKVAGTTGTVNTLRPGTYTVTARDVRMAGSVFRADPISQQITVIAGLAPSLASLTYGPAPSTIEVALNGLPSGATPTVHLTSPSGDIVNVNANTFRIATAAPGRWRLAASNVLSGGFTYIASPAARDTTVNQGDTLRFAVNYGVNTGAIAVVVGGLPDGATGSVAVSGPGGFSRVVTSTSTLTDLTPGTYTVTADSVIRNGLAWRSAPVSQPVTVTASIVAAPASVTYTAVTGTLVLTVSGVPTAASGSVHVQGPYGFDRTLTTSTVLSAVAVGSYSISAAPIASAGVPYDVQPSVVNRTITLGGRDSVDMRYQNATGSAQITVSGLPGGTNASATLTGNGTSVAITGSTTLQNLLPGTYTLSASSVQSGIATYSASPTTQSVVIVRQQQAIATLNYALTSGAIAVAITGLPTDATGSVTVSGPAGFTRALTATSTLVDLAPGTYFVTADSVIRTGVLYRATPPLQSATVTASAVAAPATVAYTAQSGTLVVSVSNVPSGASGSVRIVGPYGFDRTISSTTVFSPAAIGAYTISAAPVQSQNTTFDVQPASVSRSVALNVRDSVDMNYQNATGSLQVAVSGLPGGSNAAITLTGNAQSFTITGTTTLQNLTPGTYTLSASTVSASGSTYAGSPSTQSVIVARQVQASATVTYALANGSIAIAVTGLPNGATGSVTVTGPGGFNQSVTATQTLMGLQPGTYTVAADSVIRNGYAYRATPPTQQVNVTTSPTAAPANVAYAANVGTLVVSITGVPGGASGSVRVTGPYGFDHSISSTTVFSPAPVGTFSIAAASLVTGGVTYDVTPATVNRLISASGRDSVNMNYSSNTGSAQITVNGLPNGVNASATLTGNSQTYNITASTVVSNLAVGSYTLTASNVTSGQSTYTAAPTSQNVNITKGVQSSATVTYTAPAGGGGFDIVLDAAYLTQATQKMDGSVALVAGRDALLRVFAHATTANLQTSTVRARIYDGATLVQTVTIAGPTTSIPTAVDESTLSSSWNVTILGANIRPATKILVDIDPNNTIAESDETNNIWPRNGTPQSVTVNTVPALNVTFVPVTVHGLTGNVTAGNMSQYLVSTKRMWPILDVNASVRATPFSSNADTLSLISSDSNGKWLTVLSELNTLRATDGAPSTTHYFGIVKVTYNSGVAGYGYVPGRAAVGWDYLPSGDGVVAHELGHNFSRPHAPCGGPANPDPAYPYAGGTIGVSGWNSGTGALVPTSWNDIMGYCNNEWISDYNWSKVMTYRQSSGFVSNSDAGDGLLVWGRVVNGRVVLEPAFRVNAPYTPTASQPTHFVDALDATGNILFELPIAADKIDHVTDRDERQFAVVLPWSVSLEQSLSQVRVRDVRSPVVAASRASESAVNARLARGVRQQKPLAMPDPQSDVQTAAAGHIRIRWNSEKYPMAMVRDARSGLIMGYARHSGDVVLSQGRTVDVVFSDGVRSVVRR